MAVVANATTLASLDDVIIAEFINRMSAQSLGRAPVVYQLGTYSVPLLGTNSNVYAHPLRQEMTAANTKTETDEAEVAEVTLDENTVSTKMVARAAFVSDEASQDSIWNALAMASEEVTWSCAKRIDIDFTALASSFTSPIGDNATVNTVRNFVLTQTAWTAKVESSPSMPLMVMHPDARRDLQLDAVDNAAAWFGASAGVQLHDAVSGVYNGRVTQFDGIQMVTSSRLPVGDTTGWSNMMIIPDGRNAAIAMPWIQDIQLEFERKPLRKGGYVVASVRYGLGKVDDDAGLTFITRT
jgi:hypothetical protein